MMFKTFLISTTILFGSAAAAQPEPAALFGARPAVEHMDLSPDGKSVVYVSPGPNAMQVIHVADLATGKTTAIAKSTGDPERISYCNFASDSRLICYLWACRSWKGDWSRSAA